MSTANNYVQIEIERCVAIKPVLCDRFIERERAVDPNDPEIVDRFYTVYGRHDGTNDPNGHQLAEAWDDFYSRQEAYEYALRRSYDLAIPIIDNTPRQP